MEPDEKMAFLGLNFDLNSLLPYILSLAGPDTKFEKSYRTSRAFPLSLLLIADTRDGQSIYSLSLLSIPYYTAERGVD